MIKLTTKFAGTIRMITKTAGIVNVTDGLARAQQFSSTEKAHSVIETDQI
jgi:hypothetical protein